MTPDNKAASAGPPAAAMSRRLLSNALLVAAALAAVGALGFIAMGYRGLPWVAFSGAIALAAFALGLRIGAALSGFYAAIAICGWAAQLFLTQPLWFGLIEPPQSAKEYGAAAMLALEAGAAAVMLAIRWSLTAAGIRTVDGLTWAILGALVAVSCVSFSSYIGAGDYGGLIVQWATRFALVAVHAAALAAFVVSLPRGALSGAARYVSARLSLPQASMTEARPWDRHLAPAAAAFVLAASVAYALLSFGGVAHLEDEAAYLFQARTFANGMLWSAPPPEGVRQALDFYLLTIEGDRWFGVTMPGWPAVLSLGVMIGAPWLVNPALASISVLAIHELVRRLADRGVANLAAILMAASPWLQQIGGSLMPHAVTLAAASVAALALVVATSKDAGPLKGLALALAAGCLMGLTFLVRPQEGLVLGMIAGLWILARRPTLTVLLLAAGYGLGCVLVGGLLLAWNFAMTGDPTNLVQSEYLDKMWVGGSNRFGFGPDIGPPERWGALDVFWPGHSPVEGVINAQHSLSELSIEMFGWSIGSLGLALLALRWSAWRGLAGMMILVAGLTIGAHLCYWYTGGYYVGPRYWFMVFAPVAVLSAVGAAGLVRRLSGDVDGVHRFGALLAVLVLQGMAVSGWRMAEHFPDYNGFDAEYRTLAQRANLTDALVFVHENSDSAIGPTVGLMNPRLPKDRPVFVRPLGGAEDARIAAAFPDRRPMHVTRGADGRLSLHEGLPEQ